MQWHHHHDHLQTQSNPRFFAPFLSDIHLPVLSDILVSRQQRTREAQRLTKEWSKSYSSVTDDGVGGASGAEENGLFLSGKALGA